MRPVVCVVVLVIGRPVLAEDDALPSRLARKYLHEEPAVPLLDLDPVLRPSLDGLGGLEVHHETTVRVGARTRVILEGVERMNELDVASRGWRADARLFIDLGFARLGAGASLGDIETRFGLGTYYDLGVSLTRTVRLSRWMTAWISLGLGRRRWLGEAPPAGEDHATQIMLTIGTTFR